MIKQIIGFNDLNKTGDDQQSIISLNDQGDIVLISSKNAEINANNKRVVTEKIFSRLVQEAAHPSVIDFLRSEWSYDDNSSKKFLSSRECLNVQEPLNKLLEKIEKKSYIQAIAERANKPNTAEPFKKLLGIDTSLYYDPKSSGYLEIIDHLEQRGVDMAFNEYQAIRRINAVILQRHEDVVLSKCRLSDPDQFLESLNNLKSTPLFNHYVFDKLTAQAEVWKVMQNNEKLKEFPFQEIWRFCIDIEFHEFGPYIFENEAGYIVGSLKALAFGLNLKNPSPLDYIEINAKCGEGVFSDMQGLDPFSSRLRGNGMDFGSFGIMKFTEIDHEGLEDLRQRANITLGYTKFQEKPEHGTIHLSPIPIQQNFDNMQFLFEEHNKKILSANNKGERLMAHLWLCRELELHHHFMDGNMRTSSTLLLSLLANDPELPMMLLDTNPNLMDGNGPLPLLKRVLSGMENFSKTCGVQQAPLSFEEVDSMINISKKRFWTDYYPQKWIDQKDSFKAIFYWQLYSYVCTEHYNKLIPSLFLIIAILSYYVIT